MFTWFYFTEIFTWCYLTEMFTWVYFTEMLTWFYLTEMLAWFYLTEMPTWFYLTEMLSICYYFNAGIDFRRQNLTSVDVRYLKIQIKLYYSSYSTKANSYMMMSLIRNSDIDNCPKSINFRMFELNLKKENYLTNLPPPENSSR